MKQCTPLGLHYSTWSKRGGKWGDRRREKHCHVLPVFFYLNEQNITTRGIQSMTIDINQYQLISVNRLILIINNQSMAKIRLFIDWYLPIGWFSDHRFPSIEYLGWPTDSNRWTVFVWLVIDHRLTDTNPYQLTNFIDWYRLIAGFPMIDFHRLDTPGTQTRSIKLKSIDF